MAASTNFFRTVAIDGTTEVTVALDPKFAYQVRHTGVDTNGTDDANSALTAYLSYESGVNPSMIPEADKYPLMDEQSVEIGPGIATLYIDAAVNSDGVLAFSRKGTSSRAW